MQPGADGEAKVDMPYAPRYEAAFSVGQILVVSLPEFFHAPSLCLHRRQRGGAYWTAYRRHGRSLRKVYLGPTPALTAARLADAARRLYTPDGPSP